MTKAVTLSITREFLAPRDVIWRCWTQPELLMQWYCPKPWQVTKADMVVEAGGRCNMVMEGPEGEKMDLTGSYLYVIEGERLIFTDGYAEGFMPMPTSFMTGVVELSDLPDGGTRMVWAARHATEESAEQHREMGFETGWNAAADQLAELAESQS